MEWIGVGDRLPEGEGLFVVHAPSADPDKPLILTVWFHPDGLRSDTAHLWGLVKPWSIAVTHWMPLPEPPDVTIV